MAHMPVEALRDQLLDYVSLVDQLRGRVTITVLGEPAAVLISADELFSLEETIDILSTPGAMEEIRQAEQQVARGQYVTAEEMSRTLTNP